jgi:phosphoenolpyruvate carboxylase
VHDSRDFVEYFRAATPIDVIERIGVSSRPPSRDDQEGLETLRAVPWLFAWTQTRCLLPGWFGVASGLQYGFERFGEDALNEMFGNWHFLRVLISDISTVLAKADLDIAEQYSRLAGPLHHEFFPQIRAEYDACVELVLKLSGQSELLEESRTLRRSIRLRNPYVDPMSFLQVDLLERWRKAGRPDDAMLQALMASVNGIAHGMQNTG